MKHALVCPLMKISGLAFACFVSGWLLLLPLTSLGGPLSPEEALNAFDLDPGLTIELAAAEPVTADPVAFCFDEDGRLFVVENRGYPTGSPDGYPAGVIALLEDIDGDGRYDRRTEFADNLTFPNGVMPWRGGLIVTCAPDVLFFKDQDGNGRADIREVLLTGFATNQSTQLRVNRPLLGYDGWVYLASGLSGGQVTSPLRPEAPAHEMRGDLRFDPDTGAFQGVDGRTQFGQGFDDFFRRFGVFNRVQVQHFVLPSRYVARHPFLISPGVLQNCPELVANPLLRGGGGAARIYPISGNITTADSHAGTFSAACSILIYRADGLPREFYGNAFSCEPTGNLVHRDFLEPRGATFAARPAGGTNELVRSPDDWFRPVYIDVGPDGALYVADMYREVIEHPEYLPEAVRERTDFNQGKGMGRIWRVRAARAPEASGSAQTAFRAFGPETTVAESVRALDDANSWRRDTAFRLLIERGTIADMFRNGGVAASRSIAGTVARLWLSARAREMNDDDLVAAMRHEHPGVRETGIRLAESRLATSDRLRSELLRLAEDPDAQVRFRCALALGEARPAPKEGANPPAPEPRLVKALVGIAIRDAGDRWTRAAVLSSAYGLGDALRVELMRSNPQATNAMPEFLYELGRVLGAQPPRLDVLRDCVDGEQLSFSFRAALLAGYAERLDQRLQSSGGISPLDFVAAMSSDSTFRERTEALFARARTVMESADEPLARRIWAVRLAGWVAGPETRQALIRLAVAGSDPDLRIEAVRSVVRRHYPNAPKELLSPEIWRQLTPGVRQAALNAISGRPEFAVDLLNAIEQGVVPRGALDTGRRDALLRHRDDAIRRRAESVLSVPTQSERWRAYEEKKMVIEMPADALRGRDLFRQACAACHRLDREGVAVGPDLFDMRNQAKEAILLHLMIPEHEINPRFVAYTCETRDGRSITGILKSESAGGITLLQAQGIEETVPRGSILRLTASELSLMPQELEAGMSDQDLADLIAYLKGEGREG